MSIDMTTIGRERTLEEITYGLELEKPFSGVDGQPYGVNEAYFERLCAAKRSRGELADIKRIDGVAIGVQTPYGEETLDNGFNLGESATGPITGAQGGLNQLNRIVNCELKDVIEAVEPEGGMVLNMAIHPLTNTDQATYDRFVAPKPAYGYVRSVRGWNHQACIDAKAQNSPSFGVNPADAIPAVNVMIGLGSALIALYANSPFEQGRLTGIQESRLGVWGNMFGSATIQGDRRLHAAPGQAFESMRDYFQWMFGEGTNMFFIPEQVGDVKVSTQPVMVEGNPPLLDFMAGESWDGQIYGSDERVHVRPTLGHLAMHQFMQFSGARIRYGLREDTDVIPQEFTAAMKKGGGKEVDAVFERMASFVYIEGRDPGANFADSELAAANEDAARSVLISPAAVQAGLLRNLADAESLVRSYGWSDLMAMRELAPIHGLDAVHKNIKMRQLCEAVLATAARGLSDGEQWMLAYPTEVLRTGKNGAGRALDAFNARPEDSDFERIRAVVRDRRAIAYTE